MTMTLIKPPALEPVTLAEVRQFLRLDDDSEDTLLTGLIKAARETLEVQTGLALINQTLRLYLDSWPTSGVVRIAKYPVRYVIAGDSIHRRWGKGFDCEARPPSAVATRVRQGCTLRRATGRHSR